MPAEPTKAKLKRRTSRRDLEEYKFDGNHSREIELKRNRGEISCAECRRCDDRTPSLLFSLNVFVPRFKDSKSNVTSRSLANLASVGDVRLYVQMVSWSTFLCLVVPTVLGSLATGQGTRFVLAATEHLHRRISRLSGRIRQLEDALAALQAKHTDEPHPLLRDDLLSTNVEDKEEEGDGMVDDAAEPVNAPEVIDAFGTLSISDHGISRFFGPTGGSESLLMANISSSPTPNGSPTPDSIRDSKSPSDLSLFSQSFPFTPMGPTTDVQKMIESHLPPWERACILCETYFEQVSWIFRGVTRIQIFDDMLPAIYHKQQANPTEDYSGPHDLALLFNVFAIGALVEREASSPLAEHFHQVARAAVCLQPVLEKPSIVTVQTLHLMSIYNAMSGSDLSSETSMEMTWSLVTLACHLSQTIGLHRDSARWGLSPKMVQRRRILFWDLFVADVWQSLNTGRPPSFSLAYIDCSFPQYDDNPSGQENPSGPGFESIFFRFAAECVAEVVARTLTAEAPSYATIMELDRKVREFPFPELPASGAGDHSNLAASFQDSVLGHTRETILLYIHRSFFAQAIIEHPVNPLKSIYAPSFLAAYRASSTILKSVRDQFDMWPQSCPKFWVMWTFAFTAAVVFGTVVTRGPRSPLASSAMTELDQACILFTKASVHSRRAAKALPILTKLSEKARYALAAIRQDCSPGADNGGVLWSIKQEDTDDELSIFAGHTRFVSALRPKSSQPVSAIHPYNNTPYSRDQPMSSSSSNYQPEQVMPPPRQTPAPVMISDTWIQGHPAREYMLPPPVPAARDNRLPSHYNPIPHMQFPPDTTQNHPPNTSWTPDPREYHQQEPVATHYQHSIPNYYQHQLPPPPPQQQQQQHPHHQYYPTVPAFHEPQSQPINSELADLGIAARDSRLDERWRLFMEDSGLLETNRRGSGASMSNLS